MASYLRIKDRTFDIQYAKLDCFAGHYAGGSEPVLNWGFTLRGMSEHPDYSDWSPVLTSEILFTTAKGELGTWLDVAPREVVWTTPIRRNMTKGSAFATPLVKASGIVEMYRPSGSGRSARLASH